MWTEIDHFIRSFNIHAYTIHAYKRASGSNCCFCLQLKLNFQNEYSLSKEATVSKQKSTEITENAMVTDSQDKEQVAIDVTDSQDKEQVAANVTNSQEKAQVAADDCIPPLVKKRRTTHNQSVSDNFKYQMRSSL